MKQRPARSPVAINEGVDGLELRVDNGGLRDGIGGIEPYKSAQIIKVLRNALGDRRAKSASWGP